MREGSRKLALHIAEILRNHSEAEIREAVSLIEADGAKSLLLTHLTADHKTRNSKQRKKPRSLRSRPLVMASRAVRQLRESSPEEFRLLSEFELAIRSGQILPSLEDLKRFGERVSKSFQPKRSRRESIGPLLSILAVRPLAEIKLAIGLAATFEGADSEEYQELARFIIKGKKAEFSEPGDPVE